MKGGCLNFWRKRLFAVMQLERLGWEINGHGDVGCGERSQPQGFSMMKSILSCHLQDEQCTGSAFYKTLFACINTHFLCLRFVVFVVLIVYMYFSGFLKRSFLINVIISRKRMDK